MKDCFYGSSSRLGIGMKLSDSTPLLSQVKFVDFGLLRMLATDEVPLTHCIRIAFESSYVTL